MSKLAPALVVATALALAITGCTGTSSPPAPGGDGELIPVSVALVAVGGSAPVFVAEQQGFFEAEGLDVEIREVAGPAAVASLQNGEVQFASLGATVVATAVSQGIPLRVISGRTQTPDSDAADESAIVVMPGSGIEDAADLAGMKVATQTLSSQNTLMARAAIDNLGGDSEAVEFVDIALPDMMSALRSGAVDAAVGAEPFVTTMVDEGAERIFGVGYNASDNSIPIGVMATRTDFADSDSETVAAFVRAFARAVDWILEDEDRFREALPDLVALTPEQASHAVLPTFSVEVSEAGMADLVDALRRYGLVTNDVDMAALLP